MEEKRSFAWPKCARFSHASHPTIHQIADDDFVIAFSARDPNQKSHIFFVRARVSSGEITILGPKMVLKPALLDFSIVMDC